MPDSTMPPTETGVVRNTVSYCVTPLTVSSVTVMRDDPAVVWNIAETLSLWYRGVRSWK